MKQRLAPVEHRSLLFSSGKLFANMLTQNRQNDRTRVKQSPEPKRTVSRMDNHHSAMFERILSQTIKSPLIFSGQGVKISQEVFCRTIFEDVVLLWAQDHSGD
uniref:Uncharacterized protein n=1 Tax=Plectus sambesii TaxID=2011161 RepID=A0A914UVA0_9BILA